MAAEWLISAILIAVLTTGFGHFETVRAWWGANRSTPETGNGGFR
jgi:hypothetical protein